MRYRSKPARRFGALVCALLLSACSKSEVRYITADEGLASALPFSEAVEVGDLLFLSGQLGSLPGEAKLVAGGIGPETRQTMQNIKGTLERNGYSLNDLVKCTVMLADMAEWPAFNDVYRTFFDEHFPARSAFGAQGLAYNARVEIECIGAK